MMSVGTRSGVNWMRGETAADDLGEGFHGQRLGHAGHTFEQHVPLGQQPDQQPLDQLVLTDDDALTSKIARSRRLTSPASPLPPDGAAAWLGPA